ncbi:T7SS effector LXG polymorphic toxin [Enterococcus larvae]|uniref:T7SS effector LXG polymorphic toxin n=1 Tax=Enterococcus larvae TaxID=2794352 RepID=UPI003F408832
MGLSFYVEEIQEQTNEAVKLANEYIKHADMLRNSVDSFLSAPLSGKAYDSAKNYFMTVYPPISNALILAAESLIEAHENFLIRYREVVGEGDIEEDRLRDQIQQGQNLLRSYTEVLDSLDESSQPLEQAYMCTQEAIRKLEEKLENLYLFNSISSVIFSEAEANLDNLDRGIALLNNSEAWNPTSGTFDIMKLDMAWAKPVNDAWKKRQKRVDATILAEALSKGNTEHTVEVTVDDHGNPSYYVYRNGKMNMKLTLELARLMAEFRLAEYPMLMDSSEAKSYSVIATTSVIVDNTQFTIHGVIDLGKSLAIGCGMNPATGEAARLLVRMNDTVITEALTTISAAASELLAGGSIDEGN